MKYQFQKKYMRMRMYQAPRATKARDGTAVLRKRASLFLGSTLGAALEGGLRDGAVVLRKTLLVSARFITLRVAGCIPKTRK